MTSDTTANTNWITILQIADDLGIPYATSRQWVSRGYLPANEQYNIVRRAVAAGILLDQDFLQKQRETILNKERSK